MNERECWDLFLRCKLVTVQGSLRSPRKLIRHLIKLIMGLRRFIRKVFGRRSQRGAKTVRTLRPVTMETTSPVPLTQTTYVSLSTIGIFGNITEGRISMATIGEAKLTGESELLSLTETMGMVAGIVALIVVITVLCFVYRTKFRTSVRMRKTSPGERRSAALSLDLMELNEYDHQIRRTNGTRQSRAFFSPLYGRGSDSYIPTSPLIIPHGDARPSLVSDTEIHRYYNVVIQESTTEPRSKSTQLENDNDGNNVQLKASTSTLHHIDNVTEDEEDTQLLHDNEVSNRDLVDNDEDVFHETDSIDLSPPPTPCSIRAYVNMGPRFGSEHSYVNQDLRLSNTEPKKRSTSNIEKVNVNNTEKIYINSGTLANTLNNDVGQDYLPMTSSCTIDTDYSPMDLAEHDAETNQDNVYIYMDSKQNSRSTDYVNCREVDSLYQNT